MTQAELCAGCGRKMSQQREQLYCYGCKDIKEDGRWVVPTATDTQLKPVAEFSDFEDFINPTISTLIDITQRGELNYVSGGGLRWLYCRVRKSELDRLKGEKG